MIIEIVDFTGSFIIMDVFQEEDESRHTKTGAKRGVQREYCLTCEVFGHSTENCDESQTF